MLFIRIPVARRDKTPALTYINPKLITCIEVYDDPEKPFIKSLVHMAGGEMLGTTFTEDEIIDRCETAARNA